MQIHALPQRGPARRGQGRQGAACQRPVAQHPLAGLILDEARLHTVLPRQLQQFGAAQQRLEAGDGLAHQQRLLVPVAAHELRRAQAPEQGQRLLNVHGIEMAARAAGQ